MHEEARFVGDRNVVLTQVQRQLFTVLVPSLYRDACYKYINACAFIDYESHLLVELRKKDNPKSRLLRDAYDVISTYYRYVYSDKLPQLALFSDEVADRVETPGDLEARYRTEWSAFWYQEIDELTDYGHITRAIIKTVVYENEKLGAEASNCLVACLKERYEMPS